MRRILSIALVIMLLVAFANARDLIARQYLVASIGGIAGSLVGAALGNIVGSAIDSSWGSLTGTIIGYIFGAPLGSVIAADFWAIGKKMEGSVLLSAVGGMVGMSTTFALNGLVANIFPAGNWNPSGLILLVSLPLCSARGAVLGYNYSVLISGNYTGR